MNHIQIPIPYDVTDYIQRLNYETDGLRVLHTHAMSSEGVSDEKLLKLREDFLSKQSEYNLAKSELEQEYLKDIKFSAWTLIYHESMLYVEVIN